MSENKKIGLLLVIVAGALFWYNRKASAAAGNETASGTTSGSTGTGSSTEPLTIRITEDCTKYGTCDGLSDVTK